MNRQELVVAAVLGLALGAGVALALNGPSTFTLGQTRSVPALDPTEPPLVATPAQIPAEPAPFSLSTDQPTEPAPVATPTRVPIEVGSERGDDLRDALLLYETTDKSNFDTNFCKVAEYYGLLCRKVALDAVQLTEELLLDKQGSYFGLVGVSADTLCREPSLLASEERGIIKSAVKMGGVSLLVSELRSHHDTAALAELTEAAVLGATEPQDSRRDWFVSSTTPEITREFTGQVISATSTVPQSDSSLVLGDQTAVTTLITSTDDRDVAYPIFVRLKWGAGSVFIDASEEGESLEEVPLRHLYYGDYHFSKIVPLMLTMRYALVDETWHNDHNYANLTIDDPALVEPWDNLSFPMLFREMEAHDFHTTIAFEPRNWDKSEPGVVGLFLANPDRYSLVQHGNNADGYEFFRYSVSEGDEFRGMKLPARPLADQERDIAEGLARMEKHRELTGIPFGKVMIFPWGISPEPTLVLLKKHNFLATVNGQDVPLDTVRSSAWDYDMYQANMDYGNFASLQRRHPGTYQPFQPWLQPFIFDLFVDKPALFYSHAFEEELFDGGIDAFNPVADRVNELTGEVEWHSLDHIIKHLYLEKTNDDGSVDVKMYGNHLVVSNESRDEKVYHVTKEEVLNVPISLLTVNGHQFPYSVKDGLLILNARVPANSAMEIRIHYAD